MPVNILQWHSGIGNFCKCTHPLITVKCSSLFNLNLYKILTIFIYSHFSGNLLIQNDDIALNPRPSKKHRSLTSAFVIRM